MIAVAISAVGGSASGSGGASKRTAEVGRGVVQATVSGNGSLEPAQQVELSFGASGEVTAIYVEAGEEVEEDQVLARVDSSSARASLAAARAQLSEAEETLAAAEESEAEEVAYRGDGGATTVLAAYLSNASTSKTSSTETTTGAGEEAADEPGGEEATKEGGSTEEGGSTKGGGSKGGTETGSSTSGSTDAGSNTATPDESTAAGSEESGSSAAAEPSATGESSGGAQEAAAGGATVSVATAEAQVKEARLSVRSAEREVRETILRAPFDGTVASISGTVGETVSGGESGGGSSPGGAESSGSGSSSSAFIVLSQLSKLKLEVSFSEADIGKVEVGQVATVSVSSIEGTELAGRVTKVDVLPSEGSTGVVEYPATILLTQNAEGVRAGMSASAEVVVEQVENAVTVPSEAIESGPRKTVTVEAGGKEVARTVTTGLVGDETTEIVSGLKPGETVVLPEATVTATGAGGGETSEPTVSGGFPGGGPSGGGFPSGGGVPPGFGGG